MKLIDIIEVFIAGDWGEETYSKETPCAVTCVRGADIIPISEYDFSTIPVRYINQQAYAKKCLQVGDIIIEKSGGSPTQSTGRVSLVSQELLDHAGAVICSNFCTAFRVKKGWIPLYVYYYLQFIYNLGAFFNFEGKTSGIKNLQLDAAFAAIPIEDISESIQNNIVAILQGLERKIAINRQINQNLEAMAKQLYDYWFVQFDFPDENGRPYKSSGGKMVWNENLKREIPEIFEWCTLKDFIQLEDSKRIPLSSKERLDKKGIYPYYGATGIMDYVNDYIFDGDYLLLAEDGSTSDANGNPIVQYIWGKNWVNNHAHIILPQTDGFILYTYQLLKNIPAKMIETGSIQKKISQENLLAYKIILPIQRLIKYYCEIISPLWEQRKNNIEEILALTKQRDELLPLLMNGQVSVNSDLAASLMLKIMVIHSNIATGYK